MNFLEKDIIQMQAHGIELSSAVEQMERFYKGFPFTKIIRPATIGDGILAFDSSSIDKYNSIYDSDSIKYTIAKFVPASGAASRMFKDLYEYVDSTEEDLGKFPQAEKTIRQISDFAFVEALDKTLRFGGVNLETELLKSNNKKIIRHIINSEGLDYGHNPKALIQFHRYDDEVRTAIEEHLVEAAMYCKDKQSKARLHFTISPEHLPKVKILLDKVLDKYSKRYNVEYEIKLTTQKSSTDIFAVNLDNTPARDEHGNLIFRPSGHGALLDNLQETESEIIFVKNIDNVEQDCFKKEEVRYKKALGGLLIRLKETCGVLLQVLDSEDCSQEQIDEILKVLQSDFSIDLLKADEFESNKEYVEYLRTFFNRPLRVCSMVKNEGQPGGGPFWVEDGFGNMSLQIVEKAQINMADESSCKVLETATHFNPVDMVCVITNYKGEKFQLQDFVDKTTGFISEKTQQSSKIKIQERPGLWNGSMAGWLTIFVETPITYFNPVKAVNDLLETAHQNPKRLKK
jgi:hypothetical protein